MEYKLAETEDAESIVAVHFAAVQAINSDFYAREIKDAWSPSPDKERIERIAAIINDIDYICSVAFEPDYGIVGFTIFSIPEAFLQAMYVRPDRKGQGVGTSLLAIMEDDARALNIAVVELKASINLITQVTQLI